MRLLWKLVLSASVFFLTSCSAQWHLKRAVNKDADVVSDTIIQIDTAIVTEQKTLIDTIIIQDTIVQEIKTDGVIVRLQRVHDTIKVEAICESDTIEIFKEVEVVRYIKQEKTSIFDEANTLIRSLILIISLVLFVRMLRK